MTTFTPSIHKEAELAKCWATVKSIKPQDRHGLPSKTWANIPLRVRSVLVMLGANTVEDPREVARRPWGALSDDDRRGIAACAREMGQSLKNASCLF